MLLKKYFIDKIHFLPDKIHFLIHFVSIDLCICFLFLFTYLLNTVFSLGFPPSFWYFMIAGRQVLFMRTR